MHCKCCGRPVPIGQARLTDHEMKRLPIGNQHTDTPTLIEWQVVKGAAMYFGVEDWTAIADSTLTYEENAKIMRDASTDFEKGSTSMKDLGAEEKAALREQRYSP